LGSVLGLVLGCYNGIRRNGAEPKKNDIDEIEIFT